MRIREIRTRCSGGELMLVAGLGINSIIGAALLDHKEMGFVFRIN